MTPELEKTLAGCKTVAAKIRALAAAGYPRAEIARLLGKRYQHVRNVLEESDAKAGLADPPPPGMAEGEAGAFVHARPATYRLEVASDGTTRLPLEVLIALGAPSGGGIIAELDGDFFTLRSTSESARRLQEWAKPYVQPGVSGVDALLAERRREVEMEARDAFNGEDRS